MARSPVFIKRSIDGDFDDLMAPTKAYRFLANMRDPGGTTAADLSGRGAGLVAQSGNATPFSSEGYFSTVAGANGGGIVAAADYGPLDLAYDSFILSLVLNVTADGAAHSLIGNTDGSGQRGFYLSLRAASGGVSKLRPIFNANGGVNTALADSSLSFAETTPRDRTATLAYDAPTNKAYLYRDGRLSDAYDNVCTFVAAPASPSTPMIYPLTLGSSYSAGASSAGKFNNIHLLAFPGASLPMNVGQLAVRMHEIGRLAISAGQVAQ